MQGKRNPDNRITHAEALMWLTDHLGRDMTVYGDLRHMDPKPADAFTAGAPLTSDAYERYRDELASAYALDDNELYLPEGADYRLYGDDGLMVDAGDATLIITATEELPS